MILALTKGKYAIVDDEDFKSLNQFKWYAEKKKGGKFYARRKWREDGEIKGEYLHRRLMNYPKKGLVVDHINNDPLDNRKNNLRICTQKQNLMNMRSKTGASKYKGVTLSGNGNKWRSIIVVDSIKIHLGYFYCEIKAAQAYNRAALKHFGDFAYINEV